MRNCRQTKLGRTKQSKWQNKDNFEATMTRMLDAIEEGDEIKLQVVLNGHYKNVPSLDGCQVRDVCSTAFLSRALNLDVNILPRRDCETKHSQTEELTSSIIR